MSSTDHHRIWSSFTSLGLPQFALGARFVCGSRREKLPLSVRSEADVSLKELYSTRDVQIHPQNRCILPLYASSVTP